MTDRLLNVGCDNLRLICGFCFLVVPHTGAAASRMASVTVSLLHLLLVVSAASAWSRYSNRYMHYYRFTGGSLTFTAQRSGGTYKVSQHGSVAERRSRFPSEQLSVHPGATPRQADHNLLQQQLSHVLAGELRDPE